MNKNKKLLQKKDIIKNKILLRYFYMSIKCDVLVIGAGPAGSSAARASALGCSKTIIIDKKEEIGIPVNGVIFITSRGGIFSQKVGQRLIEHSDSSGIRTMIDTSRLIWKCTFRIIPI